MKNTALAIGAFCIATAAHAQPPLITPKLERQAQTLMEKGLASSVGYETIEALTTEIGPRLAGSDAEARARDWAVGYLKGLGFKNVRVEPFDVPYWSRRAESAEITAPFPQPLVITALGNTVPTPTDGIEAEIVRFKTLTDLERAPLDNSLEGKIVFVDEGMTRTQDGSGYGVAVRKRSGAANEASKRGAVGALIRSVGTDSHRNPHTGVMRYADDVKPVPIAALAAPDADQLARALRRGPVTVRMKIEVEVAKTAPSGNVIAEIPGKTDEIVLIGGHLDSWDLGTGAIDDAAGVGITTGAAKLILDSRRKPNRTIRLVLFGSEEIGLLGGFAYAEAHKDELAKHVMASESDFGAGQIYQIETAIGETRQAAGDEIARVLEPLGIARGGNDGEGGPDIIPLHLAGVPATSLLQNGWDYFDLHHTPDDTLDKIDPADIAQNVAAYAAFTWLVANMPEPFRDPPETE